jgi:hypothetical protein
MILKFKWLKQYRVNLILFPKFDTSYPAGAGFSSTLCTSHASLKRIRKLVAPSVKNETRKKNANNPARLLHGPLCPMKERFKKK